MGGGQDPRVSLLETKVRDLQNLKNQVSQLQAAVQDPAVLVASSVSPGDAARAIVTSPGLLTNLVNEIANKQKATLGKEIANGLNGTPGFRDLMAESLSQNVSFAQAVAKYNK